MNANIIYWREVDLIGSYRSLYRGQGLATDMVFNKRIDVGDRVGDRYCAGGTGGGCEAGGEAEGGDL